MARTTKSVVRIGNCLCLSIRQAAKALGKHYNTIWRKYEKGEIGYILINNQPYITDETVAIEKRFARGATTSISGVKIIDKKGQSIIAWRDATILFAVHTIAAFGGGGTFEEITIKKERKTGLLWENLYHLGYEFLAAPLPDEMEIQCLDGLLGLQNGEPVEVPREPVKISFAAWEEFKTAFLAIKSKEEVFDIVRLIYPSLNVRKLDHT